MTRTRCRCVGTTHTCGLQSVILIDPLQSPTPSPKVVYVGNGGPKGTQGVQGIQGTQGLQGPGITMEDLQSAISSAALGSTDDLPEGVTNLYYTPERVAYNHKQNSSSAVWNIAHNLNFYPNVTTMDSSGSIVEGEIEHINRNNVRVTFLAAFSGEAYLS